MSKYHVTLSSKKRHRYLKSFTQKTYAHLRRFVAFATTNPVALRTHYPRAKQDKRQTRAQEIQLYAINTLLNIAMHLSYTGHEQWVEWYLVGSCIASLNYHPIQYQHATVHLAVGKASACRAAPLSFTLRLTTREIGAVQGAGGRHPI